MPDPTDPRRLLDQGHIDRAIALLEEAVRNDPDNTLLRIELAEAYVRGEFRTKALRELRAVVDRYAEEGFLSAALKAQRRILELDPRNQEERDLMAGLQAQAGEFSVRTTDRPAPPRPQTDEIRYVALRTGLFADLSEEEWDGMLADSPVRQCAPKATIVLEGDRDSSLYLIGTGEARMQTKSQSGRPVTLATLQEGDVFGEVSMLRGVPRIANVIASSSCEIIELSRASFLRLAVRHPGLRRSLEELAVKRQNEWRKAKGGEE